MDLVALADFNLVARHGGFSKAAREANRPKATLSRRVAEFEAALGLRLFERGGRDLKLTEEGRALYERSAKLLTDLDETVTAIASGGETPRGHMKISAPLLFCQIAMGEVAARFAAAYPEVQLEVITEDRAVNMVEEGVDLVIRINPSADANLVGRVFLRDYQVVVAPPGLKRPSARKAVPAIVRSTDWKQTSWRLRHGGDGIEKVDIEPILSLSSLVMVRDALRDANAAAALPYSLVHNEVERGDLVLWGELDAPRTELWALYPSRRLLSSRVSAFLDHLKAIFPTGSADELAAFVR
ncbi:LysR family transcriptional regulator [Sphingomonas sp. ID0503]|uniref:LysR family transcriptional regulator n=1 Tax=Sphingomonas sp. ID0503 TaxID=3399691 RepID=UPI003AFB1C77